MPSEEILCYEHIKNNPRHLRLKCIRLSLVVFEEKILKYSRFYIRYQDYRLSRLCYFWIRRFDHITLICLLDDFGEVMLIHCILTIHSRKSESFYPELVLLIYILEYEEL